MRAEEMENASEMKLIRHFLLAIRATIADADDSFAVVMEIEISPPLSTKDDARLDFYAAFRVDATTMTFAMMMIRSARDMPCRYGA